MAFPDITRTSGRAPPGDAAALIDRARQLDLGGRHDDALAELRRLADQGHAAAMTEVGSRLMIGDRAPFELERGVSYVSSAAERGDPDALTIMATLAAAGVTAPPSWTAGLDYLQRAATLGSRNARAQLRLLSNLPLVADADEDGAEIWRGLGGRVDIEAWIAPPPREPVCEAPRVRMARGFASGPVCDWLCGKARGRMRPATMYDGATKTESVDPHRTCSDFQFDILKTDLVLLLVRERVAALTKLPTPFMEPPRMFHYALGEEIKPHYDRIGNPVEGYGKEGGYLGDRIVTFILYLNDDFDGGELDFPKAAFRCKGAKGDAVYFAHVDPSGKQDPLSLHAGLTIRRGEKWVLSQWIHDRPFGVRTKPEGQGGGAAAP
jgi:prolyl 4-hydroxylase